VKLQNQWRAKIARRFVTDLKQETNCKKHRDRVLGGYETACDTCTQGDKDAEIRQKFDRHGFQEIQGLLFKGQPRLGIHDTGDNWNQRFQLALEMPESTESERLYKYMYLNMVNQDFIHSAVTYAKTIISEHFVHSKDRSIMQRNLGGIAGIYLA
jgi:hypothetical protein